MCLSRLYANINSSRLFTINIIVINSIPVLVNIYKDYENMYIILVYEISQSYTHKAMFDCCLDYEIKKKHVDKT